MVYILAYLCPALNAVEHGKFQNSKCVQGPNFVDEICQLQCDDGYMPDSQNAMFTCNLNEEWTPTPNTVKCAGIAL